ncbi:head completion adaptor [Vibrio phage 1.121.O._10N.286.46.C4]|nr:head completion adaptor [Vibrio phage 1.121.O._10N.286.46.C4]
MTDLEFITWLRFFLGAIDENVITDTNLTIILDMVQAANPDATDCLIKFKFVVAVLEWLIRAEAKGSAGSVGNGEVKKRKEKKNGREIEVEYAVGTSGAVTSSWASVLEDIKADPDSIGCTPFPPATGGGSESGGGSVLIGGNGTKVFETNAPWYKNGLHTSRKLW